MSILTGHYSRFNTCVILKITVLLGKVNVRKVMKVSKLELCAVVYTFCKYQSKSCYKALTGHPLHFYGTVPLGTVETLYFSKVWSVYINLCL